MQAREALARATDADFEQPWTLRAAGATVMTNTRHHMLRFMVLNHLVHHRAQLGIYLRLVDRQVPQMYGPTADDRS
ncbi:MAG: DinB family protein [Gemmatirosa sp.]